MSLHIPDWNSDAPRVVFELQVAAESHAISLTLMVLDILPNL